MASTFELATWLLGGLPPITAGLCLLLKYRKRGFPPVTSCAAGDIFVGMFGVFYFFARLMSNTELIFLGLFSLAIGFYFACTFFEQMFGSTRKYPRVLARVVGILGIIMLVDVFLEPATFTEATILFAPLERVCMLSLLACSLFIQLDFMVHTIQRVHRESLSAKFLVFPVLITTGFAMILVVYPLSIAGALPTYVVIVPPWFAFTAETMLVATFPAAMFLSPSVPLLVEVRGPGGTTLFQRALARGQPQDDSLEPVVSMVNEVMARMKGGSGKETVLKKLVFQDITVLFDHHDGNVAFMLIDRPDELLETTFRNFNDSVNVFFSNNNGKDTATIETGLNRCFVDAFSFLPALHKRDP